MSFELLDSKFRGEDLADSYRKNQSDWGLKIKISNS